jgi:hypothetical protein
MATSCFADFNKPTGVMIVDSDQCPRVLHA